MTRVCMLHRVLPNQPTAFGRPSCYRLRGTSLTPAEFERLLDSEPVRSLEDVVEAVMEGAPPPPGQVLTFDDGYCEWIHHVVPALEARRVFATFLVCPAFVQERAAQPHPVDLFYWLLDHARRPRFELRLSDGTLTHGSLETDAGKLALITGDLKRRIAHGPPGEQREFLRLLAHALDVEPPADLVRTLYPTEAELRALASVGHRLGAHGTSHRHLTKMEAREAASEISASLSWIARLSDARPAPFAYPDGDFDSATEQQVQAAGATCALTCIPGTVTREAPLFRLPREFITPSHPGVL
ncbi:polysaccharide deacetylase family protein [Hyalangium versicolor]|uniref:polysaccharide deacetylase family protein n=1 Tax=Hyalangium versicolor TaxID=2861190 RepID=UPI001CCCFD46|nr:polysaccharide deacetylase family protein [Hyalangium versicolor]